MSQPIARVRRSCDSWWMWCVLAVVAFVPWRWLPTLELPVPQPPAPRTERAPERVAVTPPPAPRPPGPRMITLADEVIVRALEVGRAAFLGCWARAQRAEPLFDPVKITLHLEIDADGAVSAVTHDAPAGKLGSCVALVARGLLFAAPGTRAVAAIPLFFRPD